MILSIIFKQQSTKLFQRIVVTMTTKTCRTIDYFAHKKTIYSSYSIPVSDMNFLLPDCFTKYLISIHTLSFVLVNMIETIQDIFWWNTYKENMISSNIIHTKYFERRNMFVWTREIQNLLYITLAHLSLSSNGSHCSRSF